MFFLEGGGDLDLWMVPPPPHRPKKTDEDAPGPFAEQWTGRGVLSRANRIPTVLGGLQSAKTSAGVSIATSMCPELIYYFIYAFIYPFQE